VIVTGRSPSVRSVAKEKTLEAVLRCFGLDASARAFTERVVEIYDEERDGPQVWTYNHDAKNLCQIYAAQYLWILGYPDQAARIDIERAAQARRLKHLFLTAFGDMWGGTVWIYRHDTVRHARILSDLVTTSREQGFPMWEAGAYIYQGWWLVQNGEFARGAALIEQGYQGWLATGAGNVGPYQRAMLADAYSLAGARARKLIDEALARVESVGERCHEAEVPRIKGDVLLRGIAADENAAQSCYRESLRVARSQQAKGWELRTSTSLARLWHNQGKKKQALDLLAPVYGWFTEGFDTLDLREAKGLLEDLAVST
jgi:predicted ATPase